MNIESLQNSQTQLENSAKKMVDTNPSALDISEYLNYRVYLKDFYLMKKKLSARDIRPYNYQMFSAAANIKSPNYLKMIIEGRRNLSEDMIGKFAKALGLNKEQAEEFRLLVMMNQAEETTDRNVYLKSLSEFRVEQKLKSGTIDRKVFERIPNWTAWVIMAMVDQTGVNLTIDQLKSALREKASEDEIEKALHGLLAAGEIQRDANTGILSKIKTQSETPDEIPVALVRKLQAQLMYLGLESLYKDSPTEREFGTLTLSLTQAEFDDLKFKLRQLRKSIHKDNSIARVKTPGEKVYQMNIQLFPVTSNIPLEAAKAKEVISMANGGATLPSVLMAVSEAARALSGSQTES